MRRWLVLALLFVWSLPGLAQQLKLPLKEGSVKFAVIGDTGTGDKREYETAARLTEYQKLFPFKFALMLGDNMYGGESPGDFQKKFEVPYRPLLDAGVKFYATLGNHDDRSEKNYKPFNMNGETYYTFKAPEGNVRFFSLESDYVDQKQLAWLEAELQKSGSDWKICYFHHPLYSSGGAHGPNLPLRAALEPLLLKYGVSVVFAGHEHFYERIKPQKGIYYFTEGGGAKLREGDIAPKSDLTAKGFDRDTSFMLVEITGDDFYFQTISRTGETVDSGVIHREAPKAATTAEQMTAPPPPK